MSKLTVLDRFWSKVDRTGPCWIWTAGTREGYAAFWDGARSTLGHRFIYAAMVGPIPRGMEVDHTCRVLLCVRPDHLRVVTSKQNKENQAGPLRPNTISGVRGVTRDRHGRWAVRVRHNRRSYSGGHFTNLADAERAVVALRNRLFTHNDADRIAS